MEDDGGGGGVLRQSFSQYDFIYSFQNTAGRSAAQAGGGYIKRSDDS